MASKITELEAKYLFEIAEKYEKEDGALADGAYARIKEDCIFLQHLTLRQIKDFITLLKKLKRFKPVDNLKSYQRPPETANFAE